MKIGFLGYEYFGFKNHSNTDPSSAHGGFGFLTKQKAEYLAGIGIDVHVIIPATSYDLNDNFSLKLLKSLIFSGILSLKLFKYSSSALCIILKSFSSYGS